MKNDEMKVFEALRWASSFLEKHDYESRIGELLLIHHTGWNRARLLAERMAVLDSVVLRSFEADVERAASGVPVQHIIGSEEFYGRRFRVNGDVLIPRPETEELIVAVLDKLPEVYSSIKSKGNSKLRVVDIGTGSGIIAVTMKLEIPIESEVTAVDISSSALKVAKENATELGAEIEFIEGDLLGPLIQRGEKVNVVLSNPPYIPEGDRSFMKENVVDHEPSLALFAGDDGLDIYRKLVKQIPHVLTSQGTSLIAFEIGHGQGSSVVGLIREEYPNANIEVKLDINGKERIVLAIVK